MKRKNKIFVVVLVIIMIYMIYMIYMLYKTYEGMENSNIIPLNIFQVWIGSDIPPKMNMLIKKIQNENPEFTYKCYNDTDCKKFLSEYFDDEVMNAYNKLLPGSYKCDLMRVSLLYVKGGIYLDTKMEPLNGFKFTELTDKEYYLRDDNINYTSSYTNTRANISTQIIVSKPNNPIMYKWIQQIVENTKNNFYGVHTNEVTGPGVWHKCLIDAGNYPEDAEIQIELISGPQYYISKKPYGNNNIILGLNSEVYDEQVHNGIKGKTHTELWENKNAYN